MKMPCILNNQSMAALLTYERLVLPVDVVAIVSERRPPTCLAEFPVHEIWQS